MTLRAPRESSARAAFSLVALRQFHGHRCDRHAAALDLGLGADVLGDVEGFLEGLVQHAAGVVVFEREMIRLLQLPEYFGLAQHHRVEAASHPEQMFDAVRLGKGVDFVGQWVVVIVAVEQEIAQGRKGPLRVEASGGVKFHPITGRDNDRLVGQA